MGCLLVSARHRAGWSWAFGIEIDGVPAFKKLSHIQDRGGMGKLARMLHGADYNRDACGCLGTCRPDWELREGFTMKDR